MKKLLPLLLFPVAVHSAILTGDGQARIEQNLVSSCLKAEANATENALLKGFGKEFDITKKNYCYDVKDYVYCNYYRDMVQNVSGTVKRILEKKVDIYNGYCFVSLKLEAEQSRSLDIKVDGKNIYRSGEELDFSIEITEPFFLYVFNVYDNVVDILFPFHYNMDNEIEKDYKFPDNNASYITYVQQDKTESKETIIFLFTKHRVQFNEDYLTAQELNDIIDQLPVFSRKVFKFDILIKE